MVDDEFRADFAKLGLALKIDGDWRSNKQGVYSYMDANAFTISIPGDYARIPGMTVDVLALTLCHEMGHVLGGGPNYELYSHHHVKKSVEGQADYFAATKCLKRLFKDRSENRAVYRSYPYPLKIEMQRLCQTFQCTRIIGTAWCYTQLFTKQNCQGTPTGRSSIQAQLSLRSPIKVPETLRELPSLQCRLDTYVAGAICPLSEFEAFDPYDLSVGACMSDALNQEEVLGARPACWFSPTLHESKI